MNMLQGSRGKATMDNGFHLCTIKVPMVYMIGQLECATCQCYFINALFDIIF